ncbi:MAG: hypothetical protein K2X98_05870 [Alphaproteobacteria bacterium]|nr:hypothetical protein [Alphaproteobacteria bacterium]
MYPLILGILSMAWQTSAQAEIAKDERHQEPRRSFQYTSSHNEDEAKTLETFKEHDDDAELEQANFTPTKHKKERQKAKINDKARDFSTHRTHKEGEDLEKVSLREQSIEPTTRQANARALSILSTINIHQHIRVEEINQKIDTPFSDMHSLKAG